MFILIYNALKYTTHGFVKIYLKQVNKDRKTYLRIKISDSGKGMSDD